MISRAPKFSVVMPVYNRERLVLRAVHSVLDQTEQDLELLVVDDASTDNSWSRLQAISDARLRTFRHTHNRGGSAARNTALAAARGKLVAFIDSDDTWLPNKLAVCSQLADGIASSLWLLYHQYFIDTPVGRRQSVAAALQPGETVAEFLFVRMGNIQTSAVVAPRALTELARFDEGLPRLQDWDFYLSAENAGARFVLCPEVLAVHDAADNFGRISSKLDPDFLWQWIEQRRRFVNERAYLGYMANKVAPEAALVGRRALAARFLLQGLLSGVTAPRIAAIGIARLLLPRPVFDALRRSTSHRGRVL